MGLKELLIRVFWLTQAWGRMEYRMRGKPGMRGKPAVAEAGVRCNSLKHDAT